jgi:hypothetical protein
MQIDNALAYFRARNTLCPDEDYKARVAALAKLGLDYEILTDSDLIVLVYTLCESASAAGIIDFATFDRIDSDIAEYIDNEQTQSAVDSDIARSKDNAA